MIKCVTPNSFCITLGGFMTADSLVGQTIGVYEVVDKIGQGGMAEVYRGFHPALRRYVAIKFLGRSLRADPDLSRRFQLEAQAIASLRHPNIIQVFDFGPYEGGYYLVMEYVEGADLRAEVARRRADGRPFTPDEILDILGQVADGLDYAHRRGIVHRDVKPGNILLTADERQAILTDFGLAMLLDRISQISRGHTFGTPEYIAPEQAMDSRAASPQSDIYSLGGLLYEMVTGRLPFEAESAISLALKHIGEDPTPPRRYAPQLPEAVEAVILRALAKEPDDRFATAREMVDALRQAWSSGVSQPIISWAQGVGGEATGEPSIPGRDGPPTPPPDRPAFQDNPSDPEMSTEASAGDARRRLVWVGLPIILLIGLSIFLAAKPDLGSWAASFFPGLALTSTLTSTPTSVSSRTPTPIPTPSSSPSPWTTVASGGALAQAQTPTATETSTPAPTETLTPTPTATYTPTPTPTETPTPTPTDTPRPTPTPTPTLAPGETVARPADGMLMHFVPGGPFLMGADEENDPEANSREKPQHEVTLSPFWMDETEVSNAQYRHCVRAGVCSEPAKTGAYSDTTLSEHPVVFVTWAQANDYCAWLAVETGWDVRLPTEAQWEKAASWDPASGAKRLYPWGGEAPDGTRLNYLGTRLGRTSPVGQYPGGASAYGILDMAGNVWEWVADWYGRDYYSAADDLPSDPLGPAQGTQKVMRGGSYGYGSRYVRTTHREVANPEQAKGGGLGFRCVVNGERLP